MTKDIQPSRVLVDYSRSIEESRNEGNKSLQENYQVSNGWEKEEEKQDEYESKKERKNRSKKVKN